MKSKVFFAFLRIKEVKKISDEILANKWYQEVMSNINNEIDFCIFENNYIIFYDSL